MSCQVWFLRWWKVAQQKWLPQQKILVVFVIPETTCFRPSLENGWDWKFRSFPFCTRAIFFKWLWLLAYQGGIRHFVVIFGRVIVHPTDWCFGKISVGKPRPNWARSLWVRGGRCKGVFLWHDLNLMVYLQAECDGSCMWGLELSSCLLMVRGS